MEISDLLDENSILIDLHGSNKNDILAQMVRFMAARHGLPNADLITRKINEREVLASTGIGFGIAIPHARVDTVDRIRLVAARSSTGVDFDAIDGLPVRIIFMMISPSTSTEHTAVLSSLSHAVSDEDTRSNLCSASTPKEFLELLTKRRYDREAVRKSKSA